MSIWKKQTSLDAINAGNAGRANEQLGIFISEIGDNFVRARMPVEPRTHQPYGLLHGGVSCVLAETVGSVAAMLACDEDHYVVGVDINATHMNGIREGWVTATAKPLKIGRRMQTWNIDIESDDGRAICAARLSTAVLPIPKAS